MSSPSFNIGPKFRPHTVAFDGQSLKPLLDDRTDVDWAQRTFVVETQRTAPDAIKWQNSAVMRPRWRLVDGREEKREQVESALQTVPGRDEHSAISDGMR